jgi:hypothetical protein
MSDLTGMTVTEMTTMGFSFASWVTGEGEE